MERYLISGSPGTVQTVDPDPFLLGSQAAKMADSYFTSPASQAAHAAQPPQASPKDQYNKIAQPVAALLSPTITSAVDKAVTAGINQLRRELKEQAGRLNVAEQRIADLEEEPLSTHETTLKASQTPQYKLEKLDDLKNCSRRNNL